MKKKRISLYKRLPVIYRERDEAEQYLLREFLENFEEGISQITEDIESLYYDVYAELTKERWSWKENFVEEIRKILGSDIENKMRAMKLKILEETSK